VLSNGKIGPETLYMYEYENPSEFVREEMERGAHT
jgi:hypothetical protein